MKKRNLYINIFWIVLGAALIGANMAGLLEDIYCGFGGGLVGVGIVNLIRTLRYRSDPEYQEKIDIEINDERNRYIRMKAWSWAGYLFILIMAIVTIVCMVLSKMLYMQMASFMVCLMLILYWGSYMVLRGKN